jgi:2-desacetyl-2-hydroxyethyl bacteriochlorophyllide A dehydrogenase
VKAAYYQSPRELDVREAPDPEPGPNEVLVRVAACGICGTDQHIYDGDFFPSYPLIGGHELAGDVVALGPQDYETGIREGDRVAVDPSLFCGSCFFCQRGQGNQCLNWNAIGVTRNGGFADYVVAPTANVYPIGDMDYEVAAFIEPISCVVYGLQRLRIPLGANALIYGAGPIGLLMFQLVRNGGASTVAIVDLREEKLEVARSRLGAKEVVLGGPEADDELCEISPLGFDVVIDCTGVPTVVQHMFTHVRDNGKALFFGVNPTGARVALSPYDVYRGDLEIHGSFALRYTFHDAVALLESGSVDVKPLLSDRFPIERFPEALELAGSCEAFKVQIQPAVTELSDYVLDHGGGAA